MVLSNWANPSGCSESSECIVPMQTLHDFLLMAMMTFKERLFPGCVIFAVSHFVSEILDIKRLDMPFCGLLSVANV
ncbi:hypothetical protein M405DRAFT_396987 [Rhizopogon salebrosus TDB-379]|nr:hypothetical protein M405DRAFT_396987 [Rhizopogon salebrosus TDB-379]